jgi:hypothetical protein
MRLSLRLLAGFLLVGGAFGALGSEFLVSTGYSFPVSDGSLTATLVGIGLGIYLATLPILIYRIKTESKNSGTVKRPDPLLSFRLLVLARAVILTATGFLGWHLGQVLWLLTVSVGPAGLVSQTVLGILSSVAMLVGGVLAEYNCRLPKDPDGEVAA